MARTSKKGAKNGLGDVARLRALTPTAVVARVVAEPSAEAASTRPQEAAGQEAAPGGAGKTLFMGKLDELTAAESILEAGRRLGVIERQRKLDLPALVKATVTALSPVPGMETSIFVNYLSLAAEPIVASAFYDRFTDAYAQLMKEVAERALQAVREVSPKDACLGDYGVLLERYRDIRLTDSTCKLLKRLAKAWAPSTSRKRPAGFKFHAVVSLREGLPIAAEVTPQRTHDNRAFPEETLEPETLSLFDLGYLDVPRFIDAIGRGAHFLTRLKDSHDPEIVRVHLGAGSRRAVRGKRLDEALEPCLLEPNRQGLIDLDVRLCAQGKQAIARVVAVEDDDGNRHWYLTTVPRDVLTPREVADAYRLRWEIELFFKQLKSGLGLKAILAWRPSAVLALVYAKVTALCLVRLLELSVQERHGPHATNRLALMLTLTRATPLLFGYFMQQQGVTLEQLEERIILIASIVAKSRNQRRDREKRKREQALGRHSA
jgi:hypothetical protein